MQVRNAFIVFIMLFLAVKNRAFWLVWEYPETAPCRLNPAGAAEGQSH